MYLHVVVAVTGSFAIVLASALTPQGRSVAAKAWGWLKSLFFNKESSGSWRFSVIFRRYKSQKNSKVEVVISGQRDATTPQQAEMSPGSGLLKELPPALGTERLTVPAFAANPETKPFMLPSHVSAPVVKTHEPPQQPVQSTGISKRRHSYRRVTRRKQGSATGPQAQSKPRSKRRHARVRLTNSRKRPTGTLRYRFPQKGVPSCAHVRQKVSVLQYRQDGGDSLSR
jgi:hypothetical protein